MKVSSWKKYDKVSGLWISSPKSVYVYWFRFLQLAEKDPNRKVDWSKYEEWGGVDVILHTKFDVWWKKNWKTLFGYKLDETTPLYPLSKSPSGGTTRPQPEGIRFALKVYELCDKPLFNGNEDEVGGIVGDKWEIAKYIAKWEYSKRKYKGTKDPSYDPDDWIFHYARKMIAKKLNEEDPAEFRKQKRTLQSRVGRYMRQGEKHLDNVCKGQFP